MLKAANRLRQIQNQLSKERITHEENGIRVTVSGDLKIRQLHIDGEEKEKVAEAINKAFGEAQKVMAKKMQDMGAGIGNILGSLGR